MNELELIEKAEKYLVTNSLPAPAGELINELISVLKKYRHSMFIIGETCVNESKCHISTQDAIQKIRENIYFHH